MRSPPGPAGPGSYGNGLIASRSMESFFHALKVELVHRQRFATREEARRELFAYLAGYYNRQRLHSALCYRTHEQAERLAA
jgi:putative transposase